jgi:hypothetical protein
MKIDTGPDLGTATAQVIGLKRQTGVAKVVNLMGIQVRRREVSTWF